MYCIRFCIILIAWLVLASGMCAAGRPSNAVFGPPAPTAVEPRAAAETGMRESDLSAERVAPAALYVAAACSVVALLAVLWVTLAIARELRRLGRRAGGSGTVDLVGSTDLERGLRVYFVRVDGRMLALTADDRTGELSVALVPEESRKA